MPRTSDPRATALLILDYQTGYFQPVPGAEILFSPTYEPLLERLRFARKSAKSAGVRIYYVMVEFSKGHLEIGDRTPANPANFWMVREKGLLQQGNPETPIHSEVAPEADDVVVIKHRMGAFSGTDLDRTLRGQRIETIAIAGIVTRGAVSAAVCQALDLDYSIVILEDLCTDELEVHRLFMERVFPAFAKVTTSDRWLAELDDAAANNLKDAEEFAPSNLWEYLSEASVLVDTAGGD